MRRLPPLNALRAFEAAARHLSFQAAAAELNVTPAAISHQIKALEEDLGTALFHRLNRQVRLTDAGRVCLPLLREGFDRIAEAIDHVTGRDHGSLLTVSAAPALAGKWLLPRIDRFRAAQPNIDLRLDASMTLANFARDGIDVALRYGSGRYPGLHVERLMSMEIFPVCAPSLARGKRALRTPSDLRHHMLIHEEMIVVDPSTPDWPMWLRAAGIDGVDTTRGPRFTQGPLALEAAIAGRGVALARSVLAADDLAAGILVRPFGDGMRIDFAYYFVCPYAALDVPKVRAFKRWVFEEAAAAR